jgi:hypothetical protein
MVKKAKKRTTKKAPAKKPAAKKRPVKKRPAKKKATPKKPPAQKRPNPRGRRAKFTYETVDKICNFLRAGNTNKVAAVCSGVAEPTFYDWQSKAEAAAAEGTATDLQAYFLESTTRAREEAEAVLVQRIQSASAKDWRAALALLERRNPDDWADRVKLQRLGKDGKPVDDEVPRVLLVPPHIDDIHEWSRRSIERTEKARSDATEPS